VPLGGDLIHSAGNATLEQWRFAIGRFFTGASLTTASFFLDNRVVGDVVRQFLAFDLRRVCRRWIAQVLCNFRDEVPSHSFASRPARDILLVAGIWLVTSRAGIFSFRFFHEPIVLLTAGAFSFCRVCVGGARRVGAIKLSLDAAGIESSAGL